MHVNLSVLIFVTLLSPQTLVSALSPSEIPTDTPISSLLSSANAHLAKGETNDALMYYDVAISRDPNDYLTFFKRGATYLSLGRMAQATRDFDKVLTIRPDFEGALLQRAKIRAKHAEWDAALSDYLKAGKVGSPEVLEMEEAKGAAALATDAEKAGDWEKCVEHAGVAIMVASRSLSLRQTRVHCRFEKGEVQEGISDLAHVLQMQPGLTEPHMQISSILFYALKDTERGLKQIKQCLHADPDSKVCKKLHKREKQLEKQLVKINKAFEKKQYATGLKLLIASGDEPGLIQEIKDDVKELRESGTIPAKAPNDLIARVVEMACEAYYEMNSHKKAIPYCDEALSMYQHSLHGLLSKAQRQMDLENFEDAVRILNEAKEHHPSASQLPGLQQKAEIALKRSKTKDYYKVLGVAHDADERQIKHAYRKMTKEFHPDKRHMNGVSKEDAERKMASINEAYEVLSDPELRARFDRGDDPNDQESGRGQPFQGSPFGGQQYVFQNGRPGGNQFNFKFGGGAGGFPFGN